MVDLVLGDIAYGAIVTKLDGAIEIERAAAAAPLTTARTDDDYPATAIAADGTIYVAHVSFTHGDRSEFLKFEDARTDTTFANSGKGWSKAPNDFAFMRNPAGGDQVVLRYQRSGVWSDNIPITTGGRDVYKCNVAVDNQGNAWVCWSENVNYPQPNANFEIFIRSYSDGKLGPIVKLSQNDASDVNPVMAASANGQVWCAWQAVRNDAFRIVERHQTVNDVWSNERAVSVQTRNCWTPSIAPSTDGRIAIAWDTYEKGDYDVWVGEFDKDGTALAPRAAADTGDYEARPSLTYDSQNALWIAYELGNNLAKIACDESGHIWVLCRSRQNDFRFPLLGSLWLNWAIYYDGKTWTGPILIPNSDNMLYNLPAVAAMPKGGLFVAHSSDHRQDRFETYDDFKREDHDAADPFDNDIYATWLKSPSGTVKDYQLVAAKWPPTATTTPSPATISEQADIDRCRNQTIEVGGRSLRLIRGEYHRHTEISGDGGNDGPLVIGAIEHVGETHEVLFTVFEPDYFFETTYAAQDEEHDSLSKTVTGDSIDHSDSRRANESIWGRLKQFFVFGVEHILIGYDHILFLLSLIIASRFRELVNIVTAFTVAHSITLALATLQWVEIPATLVETLIALTIVYTAIENFWIKEIKGRWKLTFLFGLIHGFGFAGVLRELDLPAQGFVRSLLAFNVGVEVGQLLIVSLLALPIAWLTSTKYGNQLRLTISAMIAIFGLGWFLDRAFGYTLMPF